MASKNETKRWQLPEILGVNFSSRQASSCVKYRKEIFWFFLPSLPPHSITNRLPIFLSIRKISILHYAIFSCSIKTTLHSTSEMEGDPMA